MSRTDYRASGERRDLVVCIESGDSSAAMSEVQGLWDRTVSLLERRGVDCSQWPESIRHFFDERAACPVRRLAPERWRDGVRLVLIEFETVDVLLGTASRLVQDAPKERSGNSATNIILELLESHASGMNVYRNVIALRPDRVFRSKIGWVHITEALERIGGHLITEQEELLPGNGRFGSGRGGVGVGVSVTAK